MTRKQQRFTMIAGGLGLLAAAAGLILYSISDTLVFFYTPSEVAEKSVGPGIRFRLGGLVEKGSLVRGQGTRITFTVTDTDKKIPVTYDGILPDLFREDQSVVTEGKLNVGGVFEADTVLAKHDENYMPREVADALKKKGVWQEGEKPEGSVQ